MASKYQINVRKVGRNFRLFNHDAVAGARLNKGDSLKKAPKTVWPFKGDDWHTHSTKAAADTAAAKLQDYLDKRDKLLS